MRAISSQVAIFLLGGAGTTITWVSNSDHMIINNDRVFNYVTRREERSLIVDKEHSWFEPTIRSSCCYIDGITKPTPGFQGGAWFAHQSW